MVINGNEGNFQQLIENDLVLVDFFATWCGPCRMLGPVLDEVAEAQNDFEVIKVDIDENRSLAQKYGVMSVPTLMVFKKGDLIATRSGFMPKEPLIEWVNSHK